MQKEDEFMALEDKERHTSWCQGHNTEMHSVYCKAASSPGWLEQVVGNETGMSESGCREHHMPG